MNMGNFNVSESTLLAFFDGGLSPEERAKVEEWIGASEENGKLAEQVWYICFAADALATMRTVDVGAARHAVHRRMRASQFRVVLGKVQRIAALLFLPLLVGSALLLSEYCPDPHAEDIEVRTTAGTITSLTLPDSTRVWLNANSCLKYPSRFGASRQVSLVGEAYFQVTRDAARRFCVNTRNARVEVFGTEFNVEAYDDRERDTRTTLVSGKVSLHFRDKDNNLRTLAMTPNQCALLGSDRTLALKSVDVASAVSWRNGNIVLNHTPLEDALRMVENHFNVEFVVKNPKLCEHSFTGVFSNQRLDTILDHFRYSSRMEFRRLGLPDGVTANVSGRELIEVY